LRRAAMHLVGVDVHVVHAPGQRPRADGLALSPARSDNEAICAAGRCHALGIDIERVRPWAELADMAELIDHAPPADAHGLLSLWTRKEALAKALGQGLPDDVRALAVPSRSIRFGQWEQLEGLLWVGCPDRAGSVASLVVEPRSDQQDRSTSGTVDIEPLRTGEPGVEAWNLWVRW